MAMVRLRNSPRLRGGRAEVLNFATARLWERLGHPERALDATAMLREEGRLAALVGDREGAIDAYVRYLELRSDPEPVLAADIAAVRKELAQLSSDPPGG